MCVYFVGVGNQSRSVGYLDSASLATSSEILVEVIYKWYVSSTLSNKLTS